MRPARKHTKPLHQTELGDEAQKKQQITANNKNTISTKTKQKGDEAHRSCLNDLPGNNIYTWSDPPIRPRVSKTLHNSYRNPQ
jgi:hypothetical protein